MNLSCSLQKDDEEEVHVEERKILSEKIILYVYLTYSLFIACGGSKTKYFMHIDFIFDKS